MFVPNFAKLTSRMTDLFRKSRVFEWNAELENSRQELLLMLCEGVALSRPVDGCTFVLETKASDVRVGAALCQVVDGTERPIASTTLSETERQWSAAEKETFGIVWRRKGFAQYLLGGPFVIRTDHKG
eukprot:GHVO01014962.1.p2 GENE.GHVO01014962.1~~GHVO01014962.1.p2  ORF type:complete len:128 (+),score=4.51 GHVO01014962.1:713-1096(+)